MNSIDAWNTLAEGLVTMTIQVFAGVFKGDDGEDIKWHKIVKEVNPDAATSSSSGVSIV